ncbi:hypothetical protein PSACC_00338 [Paramicrosporidium saccamoebae]|uniref:Uncharacterized protein n=1 Tax=Paramicrosporidium saccamoebae TaxID=1246581 RepID=A0A2H9TQ49_9FUNG|nr:hypothetical protein PSACC_00338 [Paramicrosporidium saccamoebae]
MSASGIGKVVNTVANFLSGAETERPVSPEYLELCVGGQDVYLVTYGPYGVLPSFDPDCLSAIFVIEDSNEPEMSPNAILPFIMFPNGKTITQEGIKEFGSERVLALRYLIS